MVKYLMRFDDINSRQDWDRFFIIKNLLEKYNIKSILGVVPNCLDEDLYSGKSFDGYYDYLRSCKLYGDTIAQHGYSHVYDSNDKGFFGSCSKSEFAGHKLNEQLNRLEKGKKILEEEGLWDPVFMAPSHSFDMNTIFALSKLKFSTILDGFSILSYKKYDLNFIPQIASKPIPAFIPGLSQLCIHINTISDDDFISLKYFIRRNHHNFISLNNIIPKANFLNFIDQFFTYKFVNLFRKIRNLKNFFYKIFFKSRCFLQRLYYFSKFRKYDIYKWHLKGTFYCRQYKIKALEIIDSLKPDLYVDIGCGLGEILSKVKLEPSRKIGFDIDQGLTEIIKSNFRKNFIFFHKKQDLIKYLKNFSNTNNEIVVISMLNFIHTLSEDDLINFISELYKNIGSYVLLVDNIFVKSFQYKYSHHYYLLNHQGLIKYFPNVDNIRNLYFIQIN